jgi:hypothetical protein
LQVFVVIETHSVALSAAVVVAGVSGWCAAAFVFSPALYVPLMCQYPPAKVYSVLSQKITTESAHVFGALHVCVCVCAHVRTYISL